MQSYLVIFESQHNATNLVNMIKAFTTWGKITNTAWIVGSYTNATEIRDSLLKVAGPNDRIFVVKSGALAAWSNVHADSDWIKRNI